MRTAPHGTSPGSWGWHLDFAGLQPFDPSGSGIQRYANSSIPADSSDPISLHDTDPDANPDRVLPFLGKDESSPPEPSGHTTDTGAVPKSKSDWKSTAYATTKLAINLVKETSDGFPPLKSVAAGLSAVLDHCEVRSISSKLHRPWYLH